MDFIKLPAQFTAGTTFHVHAYNGSTFYLRGPGSYQADSIGGIIRIEAEETEQWIAGVYNWLLRFSDANGTVSDLATGKITILPDLTKLPSGTDLRNTNQRTYDAICAVIEGRASLDQQSYKINNRELVRLPISDLLSLKKHFATLIARTNRRSRFKIHKVGF